LGICRGAIVGINFVTRVTHNVSFPVRCRINCKVPASEIDNPIYQHCKKKLTCTVSITPQESAIKKSKNRWEGIWNMGSPSAERPQCLRRRLWGQWFVEPRGDLPFQPIPSSLL